MIVIDPEARVSPLADIEDSVRGSRIEVGPRAVVDSFVKIKPAGGSGDVQIGEGSVLNSGCVLYTGNGVSIGRYVSIAANCTFAATNHAYERRDVLIQDQGFLPSKGGITLEDDVWVGAGCVFLDGAYVERGAVIAAGSIVRGRLGAFGVYAGSPLQLIKKRS